MTGINLARSVATHAAQAAHVGESHAETKTAPHPELQNALFCYATGDDGAAAILIRGWTALVERVDEEVAGDDWEGALCDLDEWAAGGDGAPFHYSVSFEDGFMAIYRISEPRHA